MAEEHALPALPVLLFEILLCKILMLLLSVIQEIRAKTTHGAIVHIRLKLLVC